VPEIDEQDHDDEYQPDNEERAGRRDPPQGDAAPPQEAPDGEVHKQAAESGAAAEAAQAHRATQGQRVRTGARPVTVVVSQSMCLRADGTSQPARPGRNLNPHPPKMPPARTWSCRGGGIEPHGFRM
jgi:hypothetical protein